jgi:DNA modification methylase
LERNIMVEIVNQLVPIAALHPHPRNYRQHPDAQLEQLGISLARFSQYRSIVVQAQPDGTYLLVAGHGLAEAAKRNGITRLRADVLPADLDADTIEGILIADNLTTLLAEDDTVLLAELLQEQRDAGYDLESMGFSNAALDALLADLANERLSEHDITDPDGGGDDFDPAIADGPTRTHPGEVWQLGEHRLGVGDSTDADLVARLMASQLADCMATDPPYGVDYVGKTQKALTIQNDHSDGLDDLLTRAFAVANGVLKEGAAIYIAHPAGAQSITFGARFLAQGWRLHETLVWVKDSMVLGHSDYHYRHEPILYGYKPGGGRRGRGGEGWYGDNSQTSVFEIPRPKRSEEHPTMKPVELYARMLQNSCPIGGIVYEPFAGSGTTLIAAERTGRRCRALELDCRFADSILRRYTDEVGTEPIVVASAG